MGRPKDWYFNRQVSSKASKRRLERSVALTWKKRTTLLWMVTYELKRLWRAGPLKHEGKVEVGVYQLASYHQLLQRSLTRIEKLYRNCWSIRLLSNRLSCWNWWNCFSRWTALNRLAFFLCLVNSIWSGIWADSQGQSENRLLARQFTS